MTTPADDLHAAATRIRQGDRRIDIELRGPLAELLGAASEMVREYPDMAHDHDRPACDDYACDVVGRGIALARAINGADDDGRWAAARRFLGSQP